MRNETRISNAKLGRNQAENCVVVAKINCFSSNIWTLIISYTTQWYRMVNLRNLIETKLMSNFSPISYILNIKIINNQNEKLTLIQSVAYNHVLGATHFWGQKYLVPIFPKFRIILMIFFQISALFLKQRITLYSSD